MPFPVMRLCFLRIVVFSSALFFFQPATAQQENNRLFYDMGLGLLSDYSASPVHAVTTRSENSIYNALTGSFYYPDTTNYYQLFNFNICTYIFRFRANLIQPSNNIALSASVTPALGFGFTFQKPGGGVSLFSLDLPIMGELNFGAGSTFKCESEKGGYIGAGYEFMKTPILPDEEIIGKTGWSQPVFCGGYRFWNKTEKLMELNVKLGFAKQGELPPPSYKQHVSGPISVRLAIMYFINY